VSRVVWLNGGFVDPAGACLSIDDPGVRTGSGLFETMRSRDGRVPLLDRHLARLAGSVEALRIRPAPAPDAIRTAVEAVAAALGPGPGRVRLTVTPAPTLLVEGEPVAVDPGAVLAAASIRGAWSPGRHIAEHKTLSFLAWSDAQRRAREAGADVALLLDGAGRLGEASTANVFCVIGGALVTTPVDGILPGVTRALVLEMADVREEALDEDVWRSADEMFVTSAVRGVVSVVICDGRPVGGGGAGQVTATIRSAVAATLGD
jgi:branched-chain amino acid aminotransferase